MPPERCITLGSCKECDSRCNASNPHTGWRNIYCDAHQCFSIYEEDDVKGFPDWCPLLIYTDIQNQREKVLDELMTKIMQAVGIVDLQHYDLENSEIPVLGIDELAEIIGNLRQSKEEQ
jgi:hypothetical protein